MYTNDNAQTNKPINMHEFFNNFKYFIVLYKTRKLITIVSQFHKNFLSHFRQA